MKQNDVKYFVRTFGCKTNQYESQLLKELLETYNGKVVDEYCEADYVIINSCAVTQSAERDVYKFIRRVYNESKQVKEIYLIGCYAEYINQNCLHDKFFSRLLVNIPVKFLGTQQKYNVINNDLCKSNTLCESNTCIKKFFGIKRAYVKIQDGCNNYCSYCIVPFLRNNLFSKPLGIVLKEVSQLVRNGYTEIFLVGTNIGKYNYNYENKTYDYIDLSEEILKEFPEVTLFYTSLEPCDLNEKFFSFLEKNKDRIFPHFHIPLQSASDTVLADMNRKYTQAEYFDKITKLKKIIPHIILSSDIIVGYPVETRKDFDITVEFIKKVPFNWVHVFPYSPRNGTRSFFKYGNTTTKDVKQRVREVNKLNELLGEKYFKQICKV